MFGKDCPLVVHTSHYISSVLYKDLPLLYCSVVATDEMPNVITPLFSHSSRARRDSAHLRSQTDSHARNIGRATESLERPHSPPQRRRQRAFLQDQKVRQQKQYRDTREGGHITTGVSVQNGGLLEKSMALGDKRPEWATGSPLIHGQGGILGKMLRSWRGRRTRPVPQIRSDKGRIEAGVKGTNVFCPEKDMTWVSSDASPRHRVSSRQTRAWTFNTCLK